MRGIASPTLARRKGFEPLSVYRSSNEIIARIRQRRGHVFERYLEEITCSTDETLGDGLTRTVYFPATAVLSHLVNADDGRVIQVGMIGREGVAGFPDAHGSPRIVQACSGGTAYRMSLDPLENLMAADETVANAVNLSLKGLLTQAEQRLFCSTFHTVKQRLCTWLLMLADRVTPQRLEITHEQISLNLGTSRTSVSIIAHQLMNDGVIKYSRGRLGIIDRDALAKEACECYSVMALRGCSTTEKTTIY